MLGTIFRTREGRDGVFVGGAVRLVVLGIVFDTYKDYGQLRIGKVDHLIC